MKNRIVYLNLVFIFTFSSVCNLHAQNRGVFNRIKDLINTFINGSGISQAQNKKTVLYLYRGDARPPEEIFTTGFFPKGNNDDLAAHILGIIYNPDSAFISTSRNEEIAREIAMLRARNGSGFLYFIEGRFPDYIDVPEYIIDGGPMKLRPFLPQIEFAIRGRINPRNITKALEISEDGETLREFTNPSYTKNKIERGAILQLYGTKLSESLDVAELKRKGNWKLELSKDVTGEYRGTTERNRGYRTQYLSPLQQKARKVFWEDGKLYNSYGYLYDSNDSYEIDTGDYDREKSVTKTSIFVVTEDGDLILSNLEAKSGFRHSSLSMGKPVQYAGKMMVKEGVIQYIVNDSGNYELTNPANFVDLIDSLSTSGIDLSQAKVFFGMEYGGEQDPNRQGSNGIEKYKTILTSKVQDPELKKKFREFLDHTGLGNNQYDPKTDTFQNSSTIYDWYKYNKIITQFLDKVNAGDLEQAESMLIEKIKQITQNPAYQSPSTKILGTTKCK